MPSSARAIARQILQIMPAITRTVASELRRGNQYVTPSHLGVLATLVQRPFSLSELSEILAVSLPTMSNSITTFVERGWVKRTQASHDRRFITIELTEAGRKTLEDIRHRAELRLAMQLAPLSTERREELWAALTILQEIYQHKAERENDGTAARKNGAGSNRARRGGLGRRVTRIRGPQGSNA
jgi:DNA-binding MarR family transcriptional regulator